MAEHHINSMSISALKKYLSILKKGNKNLYWYIHIYMYVCIRVCILTYMHTYTFTKNVVSWCDCLCVCLTNTDTPVGDKCQSKLVVWKQCLNTQHLYQYKEISCFHGRNTSANKKKMHNEIQEKKERKLIAVQIASNESRLCFLFQLSSNSNTDQQLMAD